MYRSEDAYLSGEIGRAGTGCARDRLFQTTLGVFHILAARHCERRVDGAGVSVVRVAATRGDREDDERPRL